MLEEIVKLPKEPSKILDILEIPEFEELIDYHLNDNFPFTKELTRGRATSLAWGKFIKFSDTEIDKALAWLRDPRLQELRTKFSTLEEIVKLPEANSKALEILRISEFKIFINNDATNLVSLMKYSDIERSKALTWLKNPNFPALGENKVKMLEEIINIPEAYPKALEILKNQELKEFIGVYAKNLVSLIKCSDTERSKALIWLKDSEFKWIIGHNDKTLISLINFSDVERSKALYLFKTPELKELITGNLFVDRLKYFVNLKSEDLHKILQMLKDPIAKVDLFKAMDKASYSKNFQISINDFLNIADKSKNSKGVTVLASIKPVKTIEEQYFLSQANSLSIAGSNPMLIDSATQTYVAQSNNSLTNKVPQVALAGTLIYAATKLLNQRSNNSLAVNTNVKDMDKKLLSLNDQFKLLHDKRVEKYNNSPTFALLEEINHYKKLQDQAAINLEKLTNFNKLKGLNKKDLQYEANKIWENYKKLEEAKKLNNNKNIADIISSAKIIRKAPTK